ncbi:MAG: virulence RhuM family protein [Betaproteobacteria bacterium]|nr:virulence RhuM family protein [Betaproteobacteria bacterium]
MAKKHEISIVRSSAAEYLTFVAASGQGDVEAVYADENVWITQKMMAQLYDVDVRTINYHLKKVFSDSELQEDSVIQNFRITAADGKSYDTQHYNLAAIIAVGYKVNSERAVQFRKWATTIIESFTVKGYAMDDERLKNDGSVLTRQYFEEQLQRIREIRLSERKFYQKITDIYATAIDYDVTAKATKRFFATVQNKLHWAIHGQTAAEVIYHRADADKEHMGLRTWADAPHGKIQKFDVAVAKNYLSVSEMAQLERLVSAYLDVAESMALRQIPMTMQDWETRLSRFIEAADRDVLQDAGKVTAEIAKAHAESEFEKYRIVQDRLFVSDFDRMVKQLEESRKKTLTDKDKGGKA